MAGKRRGKRLCKPKFTSHSMLFKMLVALSALSALHILTLMTLRHTDATLSHSETLTSPHSWAQGVPLYIQKKVISKVRDHCGMYVSSNEELLDITRAFVGSYPPLASTMFPKSMNRPWAPSEINFDPESPITRVLFLTDISTYTRFAVRQFYHYFFAAAADNRIYARLWGYGFPGYDMSKSVADNLRAKYNGRIFYDTVIVQELSAAGFVKAEDMRELREHGVFTGAREHEAFHGRLDSNYEPYDLSFFHLAYSLDMLSNLERGGRTLLVHVPHLPDFGMMTGFGQVARDFIATCTHSAPSLRNRHCLAASKKLRETPIKKSFADRRCDVLLV